MSILSVDTIQPIGSGTSVTVNSAATLVLNNANSTGVITATSFSGSGANLTGVLKNIVEDTSPQLGGNLDCNNFVVTLNDSTGSGNNRFKIGNAGDLQILHNGTDSIIDNATNNLFIRSGSTHIQSLTGEDKIVAEADGAVELYHNNSKKIETTNTGAVVTGICTATSFSGSGENLTYTTQLSHRNKIINGAMRVSQRATSKTDANAGYHTIDRMRMSTNSISTTEITHEQSTDSPDEFSKSLKLTTTTAEGSVNVEDALRCLHYRIEGQDLQDLNYGTSSAKSLTLSFHVKSSVTGTYALSFRNITAGTARLRSTTYTIDSANTWEKKIITIAGDTSTAIIDDNTNRFEIYWCGGSGTNFTSSNVAVSGWANYVSGGLHYGQTVQLQNTLNSTFLITGVQLELGSVATPFEHRSFGEELARCQRYFYRVQGDSGDRVGIGGCAVNTTEARMNVTFPVTMRTIPTISGAGTAQFDALNDSADFNCSNMTIESAPTGLIHSLGLQIVTSGMTGGQGGNLRFRSNGSSLSFTAEL